MKWTPPTCLGRVERFGGHSAPRPLGGLRLVRAPVPRGGRLFLSIAFYSRMLYYFNPFFVLLILVLFSFVF